MIKGYNNEIMPCFRFIVIKHHIYLSIFFSATSVDPCPCPSDPCECPCSPPILSIISINKNPVSNAKPTYWWTSSCWCSWSSCSWSSWSPASPKSAYSWCSAWASEKHVINLPPNQIVRFNIPFINLGHHTVDRTAVRSLTFVMLCTIECWNSFRDDNG